MVATVGRPLNCRKAGYTTVPSARSTEWGSKPKPAEFLKPLHFNCLASATATSRALRAAVQSAHIGPLARHRSIPVMPVENFPEKVHFRESNLLQHQVGSHPASIGDRSATHRFRESLVTTGSPLEQPDVQQHSQEHLTQVDILRLSDLAFLQTKCLRRRCGQAGHVDPAAGIVQS